MKTSRTLFHNPFVASENKFLEFVCALLLFLPSTMIAPASLYYLLPFLLIYIASIEDKNTVIFKAIFITLSISLVFNLMFFFITSGDLAYHGNFLPLQLSLIFALLCSLFISKSVAKFLILFCLLECVCGFLQFSLGVKSFFDIPVVASYDTDLLYFNRVYGLSSNSSTFAGNIILGLVLFEFFFANRAKFLAKVAIYTIFFFGLIVAFSRSGLLAIIFYFFLISLRNFMNKKGVFTLLFILAVFIFLAIYSDFSMIFEQFTRGKDKVEISGRDMIWSEYLTVINKEYFFGNFGFRDYIDFSLYGPMHAHNSYVMLFFISGIIVGSITLFFVLILTLVQKDKMIKLAPIFIYSTAQYFLFWGASFADIVFFSVLISRSIKP